jgi:protein arginine kinase activator
MLCSLCKVNEAKVHYSHLADGKVQKIDLCPKCAKEKGVEDPTNFAIADLLFGLGAAQEMEQATGGGDLACPKCGFTQADFKKVGRFGCPECYTTFGDGLEALLKTMHKGVRHVGKVPQSLQRAREAEEKLKQLQEKLKEAIAKEDYEMAARLRDELRQLKEKTVTTPAS